MELKPVARRPHAAVDPPLHALDHEVRLLQASLANADPQAACDLFDDLHRKAGAVIGPATAGLLTMAVTWGDAEKALAAAISATQHRLAAVGRQVCAACSEKLGAQAPATRRAVALTLFHMGESVKCEIVAHVRKPHDFGAMHALLRTAIEGGYRDEAQSLDVHERRAKCTAEGLYFRALLLARFAGGNLNATQIEILDTWMLMWMPVLKGVAEAPPGAALRADLDSKSGLRRGPRPGPGPSLYLAPKAIEGAYKAVLREFHAGHMVPPDGCTAQFRIEEHIAVLDVIRRGLRESMRAPAARAERRKADVQAELFLGLAEIMARGFAPSAPQTSQLTLAASDGQRVDAARRDTDRDVIGDDAYQLRRRMVRVVNESDSGFGLEGNQADCAGISAGELVALRPAPGQPLEICKVVRSVPAAAPGRVVVGALRLSAQARPVTLVEPQAEEPSQRDISLLFVPDEDESGRYDACLVTERAFEQRLPLEAYLGDSVYTFRFNRPRARGRGWVLAGFEIVAARAAQPA
jgi:hypothetical protein